MDREIRENNMKTDYEAMFKFQMWRRQSTQMNQVLSWDIENIYIGTKQ